MDTKTTTDLLDTSDLALPSADFADDTADRLRGLWEALAYLEQEAQGVVTSPDVGILIGCARMALERHYGGSPPPEPGRGSRFN